MFFVVSASVTLLVAFFPLIGAAIASERGYGLEMNWDLFRDFCIFCSLISAEYLLQEHVFGGMPF